MGGDIGMGASLGSFGGPLGSLIGAGAGALLGGITGLFQKKKANQILGQNPYPTEAVPNEVLANQQLAQNMALEGMPSEQYSAAEKDIQRQQNAAIRSATDRRSGVQLTGAIQQQSDDATAKLNAESAAMRRQNQLNLQTVNNQVAGWRDKVWDWNQRQKYLQNYQYGQSLLGQGNANMFSGADKLLGGLTQGYASGMFTRNGRAPISGTGGPDVDLSQYGITAQ